MLPIWEVFHPICKLHKSNNMHLPTTWYPGGPSLEYIHFTVPDSSHPWRCKNAVKNINLSANYSTVGKFRGFKISSFIWIRLEN